jgi:hypothetical protein
MVGDRFRVTSLRLGEADEARIGWLWLLSVKISRGKKGLGKNGKCLERLGDV